MASASGIQRWTGQLAVVTGASSGIGAAVCAALLGNGINVVGVSRSAERLGKAAESWAKLPGKFQSLECDLSELKQADSLIGQVVANHGRPTILINNAGIALEGSLCESATEDFAKMMNVNVISVGAVTRDFIRSMRDSDPTALGHVINISSLAAHRLPPAANQSQYYLHFYSATKFALRVLADGHKVEINALKLPIRVSCVSPGLVKTGFHDNLPFDRSTATMLQPQEVADGVLFALSAPRHAQVDDIIMRPFGQS